MAAVSTRVMVGGTIDVRVQRRGGWRAENAENAESEERGSVVAHQRRFREAGPRRQVAASIGCWRSLRADLSVPSMARCSLRLPGQVAAVRCLGFITADLVCATGGRR